MGTKLITLAIVKFCIQSTETSWVWDCSIMKYIIILYNAPGGPVDNDTFNSNISNIISAKSTSFSKFPTFFFYLNVRLFYSLNTSIYFISKLISTLFFEISTAHVVSSTLCVEILPFPHILITLITFHKLLHKTSSKFILRLRSYR